MVRGLHFVSSMLCFFLSCLLVCQCWYRMRTITSGLRFMVLSEKGSCERVFQTAWWNSFGSMCLGHEGVSRQMNRLGSRKELDEFIMSHSAARM